MAAILAIWNRNGRPVEPAIVQTMLAASSHRAVDGQNVYLDGPIALAHQHFYLTPQDVGEIQPLTDGESGLVITCDARLDDRNSLAERLLVDDANRLSDAQLVLRSYLRWGPDCVDHLLGDFAFVVWEPKEQRLFVARDALGARDLCFFENDDVYIVASEIRQVLVHPSVNRKINERKVADYLLAEWSDQVNTFYEDIFYWPPGHCGFVTPLTRTMRQYWSLDPGNATRHREMSDYADEYLGLLLQAVNNRQRVNGRIALSLSGGPDSASLAALMSLREGGARPLCISYVFDEYPECDERKFIQPVLDRFDLDSIFIKGDRLWPLSDINTWPIFEDIAGQDPFARLPLAVIGQASARDCRVVFNGHYSDVLLAGGKYWAFEMLMRGDIGKLFRTLSAAPSKRGEVAQLLRYTVSAWLPRTVKALWHGGVPARASESFVALDPRFVAHNKLEDRFKADAPAGWGLSHVRQQRVGHLTSAINAQGTGTFRWLTNRKGIEYLDPFWDRRLIEYVASAPSDILGRPPYTKWLLRESMRDHLPDAVLWRRDKTSLLSFFEAGLTGPALKDVRNLLTNPRVVQRGYIGRGWLVRQMSVLGDGNDRETQKIPYVLWRILCLELWLRRFWHG